MLQPDRRPLASDLGILLLVAAICALVLVAYGLCYVTFGADHPMLFRPIKSGLGIGKRTS